MNKGKSRFGRTAVLVIGGVAIGLYGLWLWLALSALVLGSEGFRTWVKRQEGYQSRTAKLPLWGDDSAGRLFVSLTMYLLPLSLAIGFLMLMLIQSGRTFAIMATIGLLGLLFLHIWFVYGDKRLDAKAIGESVVSSLRFSGENKRVTGMVSMGVVFPLLIGLLTMAMWSPTAAEELPATEIGVEGEPGKEALAGERSGFVAIDYDEESDETADLTESAVVEATGTSLPANTPLPTNTLIPTATDAPTETAVPPTWTAEPTKVPTTAPTETAPPAPTATKTVIPAPTSTSIPVAGDALEMALVTYVADGDTIVVDLNGVEERVRYIGIDTPEVGDPCGDEATQANRQLVNGQMVRLEKDISERDRYGRLLRYVYVGDLFVNAELVKEGWAVAYRYEPDTSQAGYLESLAVTAPQRECAVAAQPAPPTAAPAVPEPTLPPAAPTEPPPPPTPEPPPPAEPPAAQACEPGYDPCIPPGPDVDCAGGSGNGPRYVQGPVTVTGSDPYGLDRDKDGIGCE